ncbi:hypothetical protein GXW82_09750 [Streptacidiphilus sp. 4-A2]|nr:hypothetical protein [Streptacidiphilus sp. 4-A2]
MSDAVTDQTLVRAPNRRDPRIPRPRPVDRLGSCLLAAVRWAGFGGLAFVGASSMLAAPCLLLEAGSHTGWQPAGGPAGGDLWLALILSFLPCLVLSARWAVGRTDWAAGGATLLPPVLLLAAVVDRGGVLPVGIHGWCGWRCR